MKALIAGLLEHAAPAFLIHLSGTGIVSDWSEPEWRGKLNPKIWDDIADIEAITSREDFQLHRNVDKIIQAAAAEHSDHLKTAIVCPPDIYGPGRGPGRTQSVYFPMYFQQVKKLGHAFYADQGTSTRSWVHLEDLMTVYLKLVEAAVAGGQGADWGKEVRVPEASKCFPSKLRIYVGLLLRVDARGIADRRRQSRGQAAPLPRPNQ